jgi:hypothetical protein
MMQFNWLTLIIGLIALFAGYKLNQRANEQSEKRIIEALTAEIQKLKQQQQTSRNTGNEQAQINGLEKALKLITNK